MPADLFQFRDHHYLILVDYYSRFPEVYRLSGLHSGNVIQGMKQIFSCHGIPDELHSDNGPQFVSVEFRNFSRSYGFSHTTTSPHYPRGNGLLQTVKNLLYKSEARGEGFHLALLAYRATPHQTTNVSPAQLLGACVRHCHPYPPPGVGTERHIACIRYWEQVETGDSSRSKERRTAFEGATAWRCSFYVGH